MQKITALQMPTKSLSVASIQTQCDINSKRIWQRSGYKCLSLKNILPQFVGGGWSENTFHSKILNTILVPPIHYLSNPGRGVVGGPVFPRLSWSSYNTGKLVSPSLPHQIAELQ